MAKKTITQQPINKYPKIVDRRLDQLRFSLEEQKSEALAISFMPNIRYLTNFSGSNALLFIMANEIHFVTDEIGRASCRERV